MKLTKQEWKELSDRLMLALRPTQHAVAMKFIKKQEEFDAIPNVEYCQNKASVCKLIGMASHFQGTFGLTTEHFSGYYCAINNGCMAPTGMVRWCDSLQGRPHGTMTRKMQETYSIQS